MRGFVSTTEQFAEYRRFFMLGEEFRRGALRVDPDDPEFDSFALARGEWRPARALRFNHDHGTQAYDLVGTTYAVAVLVSERFLDVLKTHEFSGWSTYPVTVRGRNSEPVEGLHGFQITGRAGPIRERLSERVMLPPPMPQGRAMSHLKGLFFEPGTWDGSDIFAPAGTAFMCAQEAVVSALAEAAITNVTAERLTELDPCGLAGRSLALSA